MKVMLINPKTSFLGRGEGGRLFPLGLAAVAGSINQIADVRMFDMNLGGDLLMNVSEFNPTVVGVSCFMDTFCEVQRMCRTIKSNFPSTIIVLGGPFATVASELYLTHTVADIIVVGEGEITFLEIMVAISAGDVFQAKGIAFMGSDQKVMRTPTREAIDLSLHAPGYSFCSPDKYLMWKGVGLQNAISITTSRGCSGKCIFCNPNYLGKFRELSVGKFKEQLDSLLEITPGLRGLFFSDATFTASKERTLQVCRIIQGRNLEFEALCRADTLDLELLRIMKDSGCRQIGLGLESLSPKVLKKSGKGMESSDQLKALDMIRQAGINPIVYLLFGLPGDTEDSMQYTMRTIMDQGYYIRPNILVPIPGTGAYEIAEKRGIIPDLYAYASWYSQQCEMGLQKISGINLSEVPNKLIQENILKIWDYNITLGA